MRIFLVRQQFVLWLCTRARDEGCAVVPVASSAGKFNIHQHTSHSNTNVFDLHPSSQDVTLLQDQEWAQRDSAQNYGRAQFNHRRSLHLLWTNQAVPGQNILRVHETLPRTAKTSQGNTKHKQGC